MKLRLVGGPVEAGKKCDCEVDANTVFGDLVSTIEAALNAPLSGYVLHTTEIDGKKVKAGPAINMSGTPSSNGLKNGAIVMIKKQGSNPNTPRGGSSTPRTSTPAASPAASTPGGGRSYRERLIALYEKYDPGKVGQADTLLAKYKGKEEQVIKQLVTKFGPEPEPPASAASPSASGAASPAAPASAAAGGGDASPSGKKSYRERMIALYEKYDPAKVGQVDNLLTKYKGKEEQMIKQLVGKLGPEPTDEGAASPTGGETPGQATPAQTPPTSARGDASPGGGRSYRDRTVALFNKYDPGKVGQADTLLKKHKGKEEAMIKQLVKKYGPEPAMESTPAGSPTPAGGAKKQKTYKERVIAIYKKYEPSKLSTVDRTMEKFKGQEEDVMSTLIKKYGPEPESDDEGATAAPAPAPAPAKAETPPPQKAPTPVPEPAPAPEQPAPAPAAQPSPPPQEASSDPTPLSTPRDLATSELTTPTTEQPPSKNVVPMLPLQKPAAPSKNRDALLTLAMESFAEKNVNGPLRHRSFEQWRNVATERAIAAAIAKGEEDGLWEKNEDGSYHLVGDEESSSSTVDLKQELLQRRSLVTLPEALEKKVRLCHNTTAAKPWPAGKFVGLEEVTTVVDELQAALDLEKDKVKEADQKAHAREQEVLAHTEKAAQERTAIEERIAEADAKAAAYDDLKADLTAMEDRYKELNGIYDDAEDELVKVKETLSRTKAELKKERQGIPTDLEMELAARDEKIAKLHQELAKIRSTARAERKERELLAATVEAQKKKLEKASRRRSASPSGHATIGGPPAYMESTQSTRRKFSSSPSQPQPLAINDRSSEFYPDETTEGRNGDDAAGTSPKPIPPPAARAEGEELDDSQSTFNDDEVELEPLPDRGSCPNCCTKLTSFNNDDLASAGDADKLAFCFSCRRSFTARDLKNRDQRQSSREAILSRYSASPSGRGTR